jgi:4-amino-4-deoxy-L-arabinose transferase-like glycosyltransferase
MKERALTVAIFLLLAVGALAWQTFGLPDTWLADEITWVVNDMVVRRSWNPKHFMYPSFMVDVCYAFARLLGASDWTALGHIARTVSAGFYLLAVFCLGRTVELVLEKRLPFAYFFVGTIGAFLHHAHIATVNSCFFFTIALAVLQFVRTLRSKKESDFYLSVLACSLAVAAKYNGCFLFGVLPVLWLLAFGELRTRRFARALGVSLLLAPLPFLATTPFFLLDWTTFHNEWEVLTKVEGPAFKWGVGTLTYFKFFFGYSVGFFTPVGLALVSLWGLAVYGAWLRRIHEVRKDRPLVFQASVVLAVTLALYLAMNWQIGILQSRYYLPAALVLAVLFLIALFGANAPRLRAATVALLIVLNGANAWANVVAFHLAAKARAASELAPLEGRIGVIAYPLRRPFEPGPLDARSDVFTTDLGDQDVTSFEEYLLVIERFFREKKPRFVVFEGIITEWTVFRPRRESQDYGERLLYPNPGLAAWDAHLERAGYHQVRVLENCQGPLAMRWLLGSYYLWTAEGVGRPVYVYERRAEGAPR